MEILSLDHVQLAMPAGGEERARRFYADVLGLAEVLKPEPLRGRGGCWFEGGSVRVHLGIEVPFVPAKRAHPAFVVAALDEAEQRLTAAGAPVIPDESWPGVRRFYSEDPFGNRLEFLERP